jgi:hypothetical protein
MCVDVVSLALVGLAHQPDALRSPQMKMLRATVPVVTRS